MAAPITLATSERLPQLVRMSARAFLDEAIFRWAVGEVDDPFSVIRKVSQKLIPDFDDRMRLLKNPSDLPSDAHVLRIAKHAAKSVAGK